MESGYVTVLCMSLIAIDGDTVKCDGTSMRLLGEGAPYVSGVNAPETHKARCMAERALGERAKLRLQHLLDNTVSVEDSGERDYYSRPLVKIRLPDGRTAGAVLLDEGLVSEWKPGHKVSWCE